MSKPKKQTTKSKRRQEANVATIVNNIASKDIPEYEKILLQIRVFKERRMYSTALQLYKKGMQIIQQQLKTNINHKTKIKLNLAKARYYHYASSIFFELNKYTKAISYSSQAITSASGILDHSCIEMMRFTEVLAISYNAMEQIDDALSYFEPIYYGLNVQIKIIQKQNKNIDNESKNNDEKKENDGCNKRDYSLQELNIWKGDIVYNIAMIYNSQKKFKKAGKYAKECCIIRNLYEENTSKQILALMLVSVIVSCPQIAEYKLALDNLEKAKGIINGENEKSESKKEMKQYASKIQKLSVTVLNECVRWSKITNIDLDYYLKTGQRRKVNKK